MADFYSGLHADDRAATSVAFAAATDPEKRATYDVEYRAVGKEDGRTRWIAAKGRGIFDDEGRCIPEEQVPLKLRFARTVRISIDGNAHFCRGLLTTRYPGSEADQRPRSTD